MTNQYTLNSEEEVGAMKNNSWELPVSLGFLILCLIAGLWLGATNAPRPTIGVVRFADIIYPESADKLLQVINAARYDDTTAGIVLEIDSPGGYATSSESISIIFTHISHFRILKKVV